MNYYGLLEVSQSASHEVIKAAYKTLMQRNHPDKNSGNAEAEKRSLLIAQAYEVLSDPTRRAAYDNELRQKATAGKLVISTKGGGNSGQQYVSDSPNKSKFVIVILGSCLLILVMIGIIGSNKKEELAIEQQRLSNAKESDWELTARLEAAALKADKENGTIPAFTKKFNREIPSKL